MSSKQSLDEILELVQDASPPPPGARQEAAKPTGLSLVPIEETHKRAAETLQMHAEAMPQRADATSIKTRRPSGAKPASSSAGTLADILDTPAPAASGLLTPVRAVLLALGTLAAIGIVIKLVFILTISRQPDDTGMRMQRQMEEKVYLQEYYQTYGVRPASRAEADLMDAERRNKAQQQRAQEDIEKKQARSAEAERRFEEDARQRAEQVSADLQYAEEKAREAR